MRVQINQHSYQKIYSQIGPRIDEYCERAKPYLVEPVWHEAQAVVGMCSSCKAELYGLWYEPPFLRKFSVDIPKELHSEGRALDQKARELRAISFDEKNDFAHNSTSVKCPLCQKGYLSNVEYTIYGIPMPKGMLNDGLIQAKLDPLYVQVYSQFETKQRTISEKRAKERVEAICESVNIQHPIASKVAIESTEKLINYISKLINLETIIVSLSKRIGLLYFEYDKNEVRVDQINLEPYIALQKQMEADKQNFEKACDNYGYWLGVIDIRKADKPEPVMIPKPTKPCLPVYKKPGLFNKSKILLENKALEDSYNREMLEYEKKCKQRLADIEQQTQYAQAKYLDQIAQAEENAKIAKEEMEAFHINNENYIPEAPVEVCPEKARHQMLTAEIKETENLLRDAFKARNDLYSANIIFGKYRDVVALSTFYEYLMSGRCTALEGPNGAYNLYETEIRTNMIISKLSDIEKSLKDIERSQYMIFSQLTEMNRTLTRIENTMTAAYASIANIEANTSNMTEYMAHISQNSDVITHNTAVTAYYSKINAELTDALGFMVALK